MQPCDAIVNEGVLAFTSLNRAVGVYVSFDHSKLFQTYVLRLEVVVCGVTLAMQIVHALFSFICLVTFYNRTH